MSKPNVNVTNGKAGGIVIKDGNTAVISFDPPVTTIVAVGVDVVFETVVCNLLNTDGTPGGLDGETLTAGAILTGHFTSIKLTSGTLACFVK